MTSAGGELEFKVVWRVTVVVHIINRNQPSNHKHRSCLSLPLGGGFAHTNFILMSDSHAQVPDPSVFTSLLRVSDQPRLIKISSERWLAGDGAHMTPPKNTWSRADGWKVMARIRKPSVAQPALREYGRSTTGPDPSIVLTFLRLSCAGGAFAMMTRSGRRSRS